MQTRVVSNARVFLKNGTEEDWDKLADFIPGKGEAIIYTVDQTHSTPRIKIGDGVTQLSELPFALGIDLDNIVAKRVGHKLTFGSGEAYQYDGSADVTVPVYTGNITTKI